MEGITTSVYHATDQALDAYTGLDLAMQLSLNLREWRRLESSLQEQIAHIC
jgi:hypothetical protein